MRHQPLVHQIEGAETEMVLAHVEGTRGLARRQTLQVGDLDFDDETPAWYRMPCGVAEACDLSVLGEQAGDGVVDGMNEAELARYSVWAMSPIVTAMPSLPGFLRSSHTMGSDISSPPH